MEKFKSNSPLQWEVGRWGGGGGEGEGGRGGAKIQILFTQALMLIIILSDDISDH